MRLYLVIIFLFNVCLLIAQLEGPTEKRSYPAVRIVDKQQVPIIDGNITEAIWQQQPWEGDFIQRIPDEGEAPSEETEFQIAYDESYLYIAVNCYDSEPENIVKRLSRRDGFEGDFINVSIDSYHDLSTCFTFNVTAAGVKGDEVLTNNGNSSDASWNPVWSAATSSDAKGWYAEMRIPLTQLRFSSKENQVWGMQVSRRLFRKQERMEWQRVPLDAAGWVSNFGELHGLKNIKPKRQIEVQPYTVVKHIDKNFDENSQEESFKLTAGLDAKIGLTNDLTLDLTINPDFGQVEADPAAIALDGFQIFFNEQRPFFVENKNIFSYNVSPSEAGNTFGSDNLFYSRRIGKSPSHYPTASTNESIKRPENTTILGAAKISGKTKKGWNIGILETVTSREFASIYNGQESRDEIIEPLTNYFVGRVAKEFNERNTTIGGIVTSTNRAITGELDFLHRSAVSGGIDFSHFWKGRSWYIKGNAIASKVSGSKNAITNTQNSIGHLFDRVDAQHLKVDTSRTSLEGTGGHLKIGKVGGSDFMFESGIAWRSPGLELNDIGFQRQSDDIRHFTWAGYRWRKPFSVFRNAGVNYNHWVVYNFGGEHVSTAWNINGFMNFDNNWSAGGGSNITPILFSYSELRGGPRFRYVPSVGPFLWFQSDDRKKIVFGANVFSDFGKDRAFSLRGIGANATYRPIDALNVSLVINYNERQNKLQYVGNYISTMKPITL